MRFLTGSRQSVLEGIALQYIQSELKPELVEHLISTRDYAVQLNRTQNLGLDEESVTLAALCHDLARLSPPEKMAEDLESRGIDPEQYKMVTPVLLHGMLSAEIARERIGITDQAVLDAIRWHATGRENMSIFEKLIYIADKIEPRRKYPGVDDLRRYVDEGLVDAFPKVIASVITWVVAQMLTLDYNSVAAYNGAIRKRD
jgi:predicted HD superfamily hydrolase involved in NAD metabolism